MKWLRPVLREFPWSSYLSDVGHWQSLSINLHYAWKDQCHVRFYICLFSLIRVPGKRWWYLCQIHLSLLVPQQRNASWKFQFHIPYFKHAICSLRHSDWPETLWQLLCSSSSSATSCQMRYRPNSSRNWSQNDRQNWNKDGSMETFLRMTNTLSFTRMTQRRMISIQDLNGMEIWDAS